ncbi:MAG TPA: hypothetical protein VJZ26_05925 [Blastocatellia bacterium]|nr:hypothetical protein [Blastocatellia bacterium]
MQEKPDANTGQSSTARRKATSEPSAAGASASSAQASTTAGASSSSVIDQAKETISNVAGQAGNKVTSRLDNQKDRAAEGVESIAQALRQTSDQLRGQNQAVPVHEYMNSAADQVERLSGYLRSTNVNQMINQVEQFARRQPAIFLGAAFVLGLVGARFLKSSNPASSVQSGSTRSSESLVPSSSYATTRPYGPGYSRGPEPGATGFSSPSGTTPIRGGEEL